MKTRMTFYYDETFHDRHLTTKDGVLYAYSDNSHDGFVFSLLGGDEETIQTFLKDYQELEKATKEKLGLKGELKSTTFDNKNFNYGITTLKRDCKNFYYSFFDLLIKHKVLFQVGYISKTEMLVHRYLQHVSFPFPIPYKSFVYSFTKLLENHRLESLFDGLLSNNKNNIKAFTTKVIELLKTLLTKINGIKREEVEIIVIRNIIQILSFANYDNSGVIDNNWNYLIIADGVKNRIKETNCECKVILDNEQSTYEAFKHIGIDCEQQDSNDSTGIRATDMFVGFVGRIIKSLKNDRIEPPIKDVDEIKREMYVDKRLISKEWFDIDEESFNLYKRIGTYFSSATYWSSFLTCYADDLMMFFSLFNFVNSYDTYDDFLKHKGMHNEYYNTYVCQQIGGLYSEEKIIN